LMYLLKKGAGSTIQNGPNVNQISGLVTDNSGNPLSASIEVLELSGPMLSERRTDQFGRFRRLLDDGTYTIKVSKHGYESYLETVTSSNFSITELNVVLEELPIYDIQLNINNSENFDLKAFVSYRNNTDEFILDNSVELLQYPEGEYEIMIYSDSSYPEFFTTILNEDLSLNVDVRHKESLLIENFNDLNQWENLNSNGFIVDDGILYSQIDDYYEGNFSLFCKSIVDLTSLDGFNENLVLQLRLKNEIEWENDKLILSLESIDGVSSSTITEITGHDYQWRNIFIPFNVSDENKFLKIMFNTDDTVNYRGFSIDNLEVLYKSCMQGDLNDSLNVDIEDIVFLINVIIGNVVFDNLINCNSDLNADGQLNVFDVVLLVEIILTN